MRTPHRPRSAFLPAVQNADAIYCCACFGASLRFTVTVFPGSSAWLISPSIMLPSERRMLKFFLVAVPELLVALPAVSVSQPEAADSPARSQRLVHFHRLSLAHQPFSTSPARSSLWSHRQSDLLNLQGREQPRFGLALLVPPDLEGHLAATGCELAT